MLYVLKSDMFLDGAKQAQFLNDRNISVYMNGGEFVIPNKILYFESLILLLSNGYITRKEFVKKTIKPVVKDFKDVEVLSSEKAVCLFESEDKYLLIKKKDDGYSVIVKNYTSDSNNMSYDTEFFATSGTDTSEVFNILDRVDSSRIYASNSDCDSSYLIIDNVSNVSIFRVVRKKGSSTDIDKNTSIFDFKGTKDCAKINFLFNELREKSFKKAKVMIKNK